MLTSISISPSTKIKVEIFCVHVNTCMGDSSTLATYIFVVLASFLNAATKSDE